MEESPWSPAAPGGRAYAEHRKGTNGSPSCCCSCGMLHAGPSSSCSPISLSLPKKSECELFSIYAFPRNVLQNVLLSLFSLPLCWWLLGCSHLSGVVYLLPPLINFIWLGRTHPLGLSVCWRPLLHWCHKSPWLLLAWHN